jgi:hypothetical protein
MQKGRAIRGAIEKKETARIKSPHQPLSVKV